MSGRTHLTNILDAEDVRHIRLLVIQGMSGHDIGLRYHISDTSVSRIMNEKRWSKTQRKMWAGALTEPVAAAHHLKMKELVDLPSGAAYAEPKQTFGLMAQVRQFDAMRRRLHTDLNQLVRDYDISDAIHNAMIDELLDELSQWKRGG